MDVDLYGEAGAKVIEAVKSNHGWISRSGLSDFFNGNKIEIQPDGSTLCIRGVPSICVFQYRPDAPILSPYNPELSIAMHYVREGILRQSSRGGVRGFKLAENAVDRRRKEYRR